MGNSDAEEAYTAMSSIHEKMITEEYHTVYYAPPLNPPFDVLCTVARLVAGQTPCVCLIARVVLVVAPIRQQLWEPAVLEQWASIATPSLHQMHMEVMGPHTIGTESICQVWGLSMQVWKAHVQACTTLLKAWVGPMWAVQELRLHQQAERQGMARATLD